MKPNELKDIYMGISLQLCRFECRAMGEDDLRHHIGDLAEGMPTGYVQGWLSSWAKGGEHSTYKRLAAFTQGLYGAILELEND